MADTSNLHHASMELRLRHRTAGIMKRRAQNRAGLMRLDDGIDPATRSAVTDVGLLRVIAFHLFTQCCELVRRMPGGTAREQVKHDTARLRRPHHRIMRVWPREDETRVEGFPAERIVAGPIAPTDNGCDLWHGGVAHRVHQLGAGPDDS